MQKGITNMKVTCNKCQTVVIFKEHDDEPDKFGRRCIVCVNCREFINVDDLISNKELK